MSHTFNIYELDTRLSFKDEMVITREEFAILKKAYLAVTADRVDELNCDHCGTEIHICGVEL